MPEKQYPALLGSATTDKVSSQKEDSSNLISRIWLDHAL